MVVRHVRRSFLIVLKKFAWKPSIRGLDSARVANPRRHRRRRERPESRPSRCSPSTRRSLAKVQDEVREIFAEARHDAEHAKNEIISEAQEGGRRLQEAGDRTRSGGPRLGAEGSLRRDGRKWPTRRSTCSAAA